MILLYYLEKIMNTCCFGLINSKHAIKKTFIVRTLSTVYPIPSITDSQSRSWGWFNPFQFHDASWGILAINFSGAWSYRVPISSFHIVPLEAVSHDIRNLLISVNMLDYYIFVFYIVLKKMMSYMYVFNPRMMHWIFLYAYGTGIITINRNRIQT